MPAIRYGSAYGVQANVNGISRVRGFVPSRAVIGGIRSGALSSLAIRLRVHRTILDEEDSVRPPPRVRHRNHPWSTLRDSHHLSVCSAAARSALRRNQASREMRTRSAFFCVEPAQDSRPPLSKVSSSVVSRRASRPEATAIARRHRWPGDCLGSRVGGVWSCHPEARREGSPPVSAVRYRASSCGSAACSD